MKRCEFVVLGLGAVGSAALWQLAKQGYEVVGIDRYVPPHEYGSSHGESRITRLAIGEGPHYSPLAIRSHAIWREIESCTGTSLLNATGGLIISSPGRTARLHVDDFFANTRVAAQRFRIPHEILTSAEIRRRFPQFRVRDDEVGYYEPTAGYLRPEACIAAQLQMAAIHGAEIRTGEAVQRFEAKPDGVMICTEKQNLVARKLLLCAGPWLPDLIGPRLAAPFRVLRQVLFWFELDRGSPFLASDCPVYIWEMQGPAQAIYGFPPVGDPQTIKVATQQYETATTPQAVNRNVSADEIAVMYHNSVAPYLVGVRAHCLKSVTCLYTQTPDSGFVIGPHPESDRILIASPCSGHGFKHSAAIGEALAELTIHGRSRLDLSAFSFARFR